MNVTLDLPDELLRQAQACALERGCSLQTFVIEALTEKLAPTATVPLAGAKDGRQAWASQLQLQPDGTYFNPGGIDDEEFFLSLERIRSGH